jgi:hypothetical protein
MDKDSKIYLSEVQAYGVDAAIVLHSKGFIWGDARSNDDAVRINRQFNQEDGKDVLHICWERNTQAYQQVFITDTPQPAADPVRYKSAIPG